MVYIDKVEILASLGHLSISNLNETAFLGKYCDRSTRRYLDDLFYLYIKRIIDPIVLKYESGGFHIHPGLNRYWATALRRQKEWLPGYLLHNNMPETNFAGIKQIKRIGYINGNQKNREDNPDVASFLDKIHTNETLDSDIFLNINLTKKYILKIDHFREMYLNQDSNCEQEVVYSKNFNGIFESVIYMFEDAKKHLKEDS